MPQGNYIHNYLNYVTLHVVPQGNYIQLCYITSCDERTVNRFVAFFTVATTLQDVCSICSMSFTTCFMTLQPLHNA